MKNKITTIKNNIIFDIDSATVAGGLFEFGYDAKGDCVSVRELYSLRENSTNGLAYSFEEFWRRTQHNLEKVAQKVYLQSLVPLHEIYCNLSSPWASSQKRKITYSKKKPFIFTQELADVLVEKELFSSLKKNLDYVHFNVALIDRKTIGLRINGYPSRSPLGKEVTNLEIDSLVTVMSKKTKETFEHSIEKSFHRIPKFTSNIFISYYDVKKTLVHNNNVVIIDVAGEMTELMVVKNDQLHSIGTLPNGVHHIIRDTAKFLNSSIIKTQKNIHLLHTHHLEDSYEKNFQKALNKSYAKWLREFYNFCDEASKQGLLPNTLVLKTYGESMMWFENLLLASEELSEHMHARGAIELIHLHVQREPEKILLDISDPEMKVIAHTIALNIYQ
jgi:hypothetical protein